MSEFKVGDKVVCKYEHIILFGNVVLEIKNFREDLKEIGDFCTFTNGNDYWLSALRFATPEEIAAGSRIDMPSLPEPVGSLQELHPEFAKVLHENFLELLGDESNTVQVAKDAIEHGNDLAMVSIEGVEHVSIAQVIKPFPCEEFGDDFPIENHISPNCKVEDV